MDSTRRKTVATIRARTQPAAVDQPLEGFAELRRLRHVEQKPVQYEAHPASREFAAWYIAKVACGHRGGVRGIGTLLGEPCRACLLWATEAVASLLTTRQQEPTRARQKPQKAPQNRRHGPR